MTTFQAIVYSILHGLTEFLPVSAAAHQQLVSEALGWPVPTGIAAGALSLGSLLALLIYFRHDWASMVSSFLQILIYRKRPMSLDERLPFFLLATTIPTAGAWYYFQDALPPVLSDPMWMAGAVALFGIPLWFSDGMSRKNKNMFDWNWFDAFFVGIGQALLLVPGCGRAAGILMAGMFRNFGREAIAKYALYAAAPIIGANAFRLLSGFTFRAPVAAPDYSWLSFFVTLLVSLFMSLIAIGAFMKNVQRKGFGGYAVYRCVFAAAIAGALWAKGRGLI